MGGGSSPENFTQKWGGAELRWGQEGRYGWGGEWGREEGCYLRGPRK